MQRMQVDHASQVLYFIVELTATVTNLLLCPRNSQFPVFPKDPYFPVLVRGRSLGSVFPNVRPR